MQEESDWEHETSRGIVQQAPLDSQTSREAVGGQGTEDLPWVGEVHHLTSSSQMGTGTLELSALGAGQGKEQVAHSH